MSGAAQRWLFGRDSYRPPLERIDPRRYDVALIDQDAPARAFVQTHHYSRTYPAARVRVGLYERGELAGVAVFSHPVRDAVLSNVFPTLPRLAAVELGRFVLLDQVPGNGETWFLARCFEELRRAGIAGVVSFSDPIPRTDLAGRAVFPGHIGTIYQAHNATYLGRARRDTLRILPDGRALNRRTRQKIRDAETGWLYAAGQLVAFGAEPITHEADRAARCAWLDHWMRELTRPLFHPGNHRYAWALTRAAALPESQPYPKRLAA